MKVLQESNRKLQESNKLSQNKLQESKILENKKITELQKQIQDLQSKNTKMEEAQDRFSKLAFNPIGTVKAVAENFNNGEYDAEDLELFNALTNK